MARYETIAGIECTEEENKLIDSLKRLASKWNKVSKNRLWLYSASGTLHVMMKGDSESNPMPELTTNGGVNYDNEITIINIPNDGGDW